MLKFLVLFIPVLTCQTVVETLKLQRVIVLSRHNARTPLAEHLADYTPKPWPQWDEKSGYLTPKGVYLEGLMGDFFSKWMHKEDLLPQGCPDKSDVFVYANVKQRTRASARAFVIKAFPGCNITVHVSNTTDPVFNPFIHNNTAIFKQLVTEKMESILDNLLLTSSYELIGNILDFKDSNLCKTEQKCDLKSDKNIISDITVGEKPSVSGPLKISNSVVDAFKMQYYDGFIMPNVAWGLLHNASTWETLMKLCDGYHDVIFNSTILAQDIALPLITYMKNMFLNEHTKFSLLMGHDANILTLLSGMRFKPFVLPNQYEKAPIGGKIMFQKWLNCNGTYFLRINYVYGSTKQLRLGSQLSLDEPPQFQILELEGCPIDNDGLCQWGDFEKLLNEF